MLSLYTLKSAKDASIYYQQGDYYTTAGTNEYSFWWGKGAEALGQKDAVDFQIFKGLLEGQLPDGNSMVQTQKGQHHRPGYDLTFSAPKSVSILALVLGNKEILEAHRQAVKGTLSHLEKDAAYRLKVKGRTDIVKSGNYTVAAFEHSDSRLGNPNLHTHALLLNMTQRSDGAWRSLYADNLYTDKLFHGMEYRSRLARQLLHLGFELEFKEKGLFEIVGVPATLMQQWSQRREEIETWLKEQSLSGGEASSAANFQTRGKKVKSDPGSRIDNWLKELKQAGFTLVDLEKVVSNAKVRGSIALPDPLILAEFAVNSALHHLSERQSVFTMENLLKTARWMSVLPCSEGDFLKIMEAKIAAKTLLYGEGRYLTTPETVALQKTIIESMRKSQGTINRMMAPWVADIVTSFKVKSEAEHAALKALLIHQDAQVLLSAGSRKDLFSILKNFQSLAVENGYYPRFLTQTQVGVATLKEKLRIERAHTIAGFLLSCEMRAKKQTSILPQWLQDWNKRLRLREARDIWVVQGIITPSELNQLQRWAKQFDARLILTETKHQSLPIGALLKQNGIRNIQFEMNSSNDLSPRLAVLEKIEVLEKEKSLYAVSDYKERLQKAVELYEPQFQLLCANYTESRFLNELVRHQLKTKGVLQGQNVSLNILQPLSLSQTEKKLLHLYQLNDVIRFNEKSEYFKVTNVDLSQDKMSLQSLDGSVKEWTLSNAVSLDVFREKTVEIMVGESLIWTRTIKHESVRALDRIKNQRVVVAGIKDDSITVRLQNGKTLDLNKTAYADQHWDYGYATLLKNVGNKAVQTILLLKHQNLDDKNIGILHDLVDTKNKMIVLCEDFDKLKHSLRTGVENNLPLFLNEVPYERFDAITQTTVTQPIFYRMQQEYLNVRQQNPEFLEKNFEKSKENHAYSPEFRKACYAVETVILYHSERKAVFSYIDVKKESREVGGLELSRRALDGALDFALQKGWLVNVPSENKIEVLVSARHTVLMEKLCIQRMQQGQNKLAPILDKESPLMEELKGNTHLTPGQKAAVTLMLTSPDSMTAVQGIAGAGKTTALKEVNRLCRDADFKSLVLANTASAKNQAQSASGIPSLTTARFLTKMETDLKLEPDKAKQEYGGNQLIIVDEASLMATKEQFRLTNVVGELGARLSFVGDFKQQGSIGAGTSFNDLLVYGIDKAVMSDNVRLKEAKALEAMKKAYAGDMSGTLTVLKDTIEEIPDKKEALTRIVDIYTSKKEREHILIITPLNEDRHFVNSSIRERLKGTEELAGAALTTPVFLPRDRRDVEKREVASYGLGDVIRFNTNHFRLGINRSDYLTVSSIDIKHQRLTLMDDKGQSFYLSPKNLKKTSDIEIYRVDSREFMQNDIIVFKRNQDDKGIFNGDKATILKVLDEHRLEVLLANQKTVILDLRQKENQHLDYGYALTTFAVQGKDGVTVLAYGEVGTPRLRRTSELKVGNHIVVSQADQKQLDPTYNGHAVIGKVLKVEGSKVTVQTENKVLTITNDKDRQWHYFPPFEQRRGSELPLSTSQQSFLVQITRGDFFYLIVPYLSDFLKILEKHEVSQQSALNFLDTRRKVLNQSVKRLLDNIRGIAEKFVPTPMVCHPRTEKNFKKETKAFDKKSFIDKEALNYYLSQDVLGHASRWLGSPKKINSRGARWPGALSVTLHGEKAGWWMRWSSGEGGKDLISLYANVYGLSWEQALRELGKDFGFSSRGKEAVRTSSVEKNRPIQNSAFRQENARQERIQKALSIYKSAIPISDTLAEKYLRDFRGIVGELPSDFRFIKATKHLDTQKLVPALIAPIRDKEGEITGITRIFLNRDGSKITDTYINSVGKIEKVTDKASLGVSKDGAVVVQQGDLNTILWVAEGIETALSVASIIPNQTVVASLSVNQFKNVPVGIEVQKIVILADRDEKGSNTIQSMTKAIDYHLSQGKRVFIAIPPDMGLKKCDFNDLIQQRGIEGVKASLDNRLEIKSAELALMRKEGFLETIDRLQRLLLKEKNFSDIPLQKFTVKKDLEK